MVRRVTLAGLSGDWPVSFFIASISFLVYVPVRIFCPGKGRRPVPSAQAIETGRMPKGFVDTRDKWTKTEAQCLGISVRE